MPAAIERLLGPHSFLEFQERYYQEEPLVVSAEASRFDGLFGWEAYNEILNFSKLPLDGFTALVDGQRVQPRDLDDVLTRVREGHTLVLRDVDSLWKPLSEFTGSLWHDLGEQVSANLYHSQPGIRGFKPHYDTHDVFVLQISGDKIWRLYQRNLPYPLWDMSEHDTGSAGQCSLETHLGQGSVLYIPRGYWHEALASSESLHITVGLHPDTGISFLTWVVDQLRVNPLFRKALPLNLEPDAPFQSLVPAQRTHIDGLVVAFRDSLNQPELIERWADHRAGRRSRRDKVNFPVTAVPEQPADERTILRTSWVKPAISRTENQIRAVLADHVITLPAASEQLLQAIFSRTTMSQLDLVQARGGLTEQQAIEIVSALIEIDILRYDQYTP